MGGGAEYRMEFKGEGWVCWKRCKKHEGPLLRHTHIPLPPHHHLVPWLQWAPYPLNKRTHMLKDECPTNGGKRWVRAPYESSIVQPGPPSPRPEASNQGGPFCRDVEMQGGPGWNGAVATEEEAVAVSLGCYLLAHFESPAASCTPCHSHWSCPDPPPLMALQTPSPPPPLPLLSLSHNVRCVKRNLPPAGCPEKSEEVLCYYYLGLSDYRHCVCMCACRVFKGKSLLTYHAWPPGLLWSVDCVCSAYSSRVKHICMFINWKLMLLYCLPLVI